MRAPIPAWTRSSLLRGALLALAFFLADFGSRFLQLQPDGATPVAPAAGLALAAALAWGPRAGPGVFAGYCAAGIATLLASHGGLGPAQLGTTGVQAGVNAGSVVLAAWILRRFAAATAREPLQRPFHFAAACLVAAAGSSGVCTWLTAGAGAAPRDSALAVWFAAGLGNFCAMTVLAPLLLAWQRRPRAPELRRLLMPAVLFIAAALLSFGGALASGHLDRLAIIGLVAFVLWSAAVAGLVGATSASFVVAAASIAATVAGAGPFVKASAGDTLVALDGFVVLCAIAAMAVAGSAAQAWPANSQPAPLGRRPVLLPVGVLFAGLAATLGFAHLAERRAEQGAAERFAELAGGIQDRIGERMRAYEQVLRGARGLIDAAGLVDRHQWQRYVESLAGAQQYQAVQAMGLALRVPQAQARSFVERARALGLRDYAIHPPGARQDYVPVLYIEPQDRANLQALGYDLASEAVRRAALERARDSGEATATGKIRLVPEPGDGVHPAFLMVLPFYRAEPSAIAATLDPSAVLGYVYCAFRMDDLIHSVLGDTDLSAVSLSLYDGTQATGAALMFRNRAEDPSAYPGQSRLLVSLPVGHGHWWTLDVVSMPDFDLADDAHKAPLALAAGAIISLLVFILLRLSAERREDALRRAKGDLRSMIDGIPALVGSWDLETKGRFVNERHREWFGIDPTQIKGRHAREVFGEGVYRELRRHIKAVLQGQARSFEHSQRAPDGCVRHTVIHLVPDVQHGARRGFFMFAFDITRHKEVELALEQGLLLHDVIFAHAGVGIACVRDDQFERLSQRCVELLGYAPGELDDMPAARLFADAQSYADFARLAAEQVADDKTLDHELPLRRKDGSSVWCRVMLRAIDPAEPEQGTIWIIDDFSDRKQREDLLREARASAEEAARLKAEFLANMSHEIRTPMNAIIGMTRLTLDGPLAQAQRENLLMVQDSADMLLRILDDVLDFSKLEAGKLQLNAEDFDLRETLAAALQRLAGETRGKPIELVLDVALDVPERVRGDPGRLLQVVTNLWSNAIKFTARGEVVCRVRVREMDGDALLLECAVSDTGIGIEASACATIFESFVQADSSVTRQYGGTGLGLAICAQLVALMHGRIGVQSVPGVGSTFTFTARLQCRSQAPAPSAPELARLRDRPVVLAMANDSARAAVACLLRSWQLKPVEFASAADALAACSLAARYTAGYPVLVVDSEQWAACDAQGREELARSRAAPTVVLLGASRLGADARTALLRKPLRCAELRAALLAALDPSGRQGARPAATRGAGPLPAARRLRILVAEDHPINQKVAQRILERRGHEVRLADDGAQACAALRAEPFDVVLMDVQMPEMDGIAATHAIRQEEKQTGAHLPIIALTAHALKGERERLIALGMDDYISKPYDPETLLRVVERCATCRRAGPDCRAAAGGNRAEDPDCVFDRERSSARVQGDDALLRELASDLVAELPGALESVRALIGAGDLAAAARAAHRMKGALSNVHAPAALRAATALESACSGGVLAAADLAWLSLRDALGRLRPKLESLLATATSGGAA